MPRTNNGSGTTLHVNHAIIHTASIDVAIMRLNKKQVTLSVFRQLDEESIFLSDGSLRGTPWGRVNYTWKDNKPGTAFHVVWQDGEYLKRSAVPKTPIVIPRNDYRSKDPVEIRTFKSYKPWIYLDTEEEEEEEINRLIDKIQKGSNVYLYVEDADVDDKESDWNRNHLRTIAKKVGVDDNEFADAEDWKSVADLITQECRIWKQILEVKMELLTEDLQSRFREMSQLTQLFIAV